MENKQPVDIYGKPYNRAMIVAILMVGSFCTVLNQTLLNTAFPTLMRTFNISASDVQWLTTGFLLVNGIMIPITAWMINKFSSKKLYLFAMFVFLIGTITCFIAPIFPVLLIGRLVQAAGVGISMPLLQNIMYTIYPPERRGAAMGMVGIVIALAPALGPTLSGWVIDHYSWRQLFGIVIPIVVLVLILSFFLMRSVIPLSNPKIDFSSVVLSTIGFGSLLYGFSSVGNQGWGSFEVIGFMLMGAIGLAFFVWRQLHIKNPLLELRVFKSSTFTLAAILSGVTNMAMIGVSMVVPMYIQNIRGESAFHSGLILLPGALVIGIMNPITGSIFDKYGAKRLAPIGMFILTCGTIPFAFLTENTSLAYIVILYVVRMFGISMVMMPVTTSGMNALPPKLISHGTAVNNTFRQVASSIGTAILVSVLTNVTNSNLPEESTLQKTPLAYAQQTLKATLSGYQSAFWVAILFCVVGFGLTFFIKGRSKSKEVHV